MSNRLHVTEYSNELDKQYFFGALPLDTLGLPRRVENLLYMEEIENVFELIKALPTLNTVYGLNEVSFSTIANALLDHAQLCKKDLPKTSCEERDELGTIYTDEVLRFIRSQLLYDIKVKP